MLKFALGDVLFCRCNHSSLLLRFFDIKSFHYLLIYDSTEIVDAVYCLKRSFIFRFVSLQSYHLLNRFTHLVTVYPSTLWHLRIVQSFMVLGWVDRSRLPKLRIKIETLKLLYRRVWNLIELPFLGCGARNLMRQVLIPLSLEVLQHQGLVLRSRPVRLLIKRRTMLEQWSRKISWNGRHLWVLINLNLLLNNYLFAL